VLNSFSLIFLVAGGMRGSHRAPLMPVRVEACDSDSDGPAVVSAQVFCVKGKVLTASADAFDQPSWDEARRQAAKIVARLRLIDPDRITLPLN
jgi:fructose 1,6-bisphosphate aldolase/phosphatase